MSEDNKVISLAGRVRAKSARAEAPARPGKPAADGGPSESGAADAASAPPAPGSLVWLYCPACRTLEYTELHVPGGRTHSICGTRVQEAEVQLDLRSEFTLAEVNLRHLERLTLALEGQAQRYREYQQRLKLAAGGKLTGYAPTDETLQRLPVAAVDALGLLVSPFLHEPAKRFDQAPEAGEQAPGSGAPAGPAPAATPAEGTD